MRTLVTKFADARLASRRRRAEQFQAVWEERRRSARRYAPGGSVLFSGI